MTRLSILILALSCSFASATEQNICLKQLSYNGVFEIGAKPLIQTQRLEIRSLNPADGKDTLAAVLNDPKVKAEWIAADIWSDKAAKDGGFFYAAAFRENRESINVLEKSGFTLTEEFTRTDGRIDQYFVRSIAKPNLLKIPSAVQQVANEKGLLWIQVVFHAEVKMENLNPEQQAMYRKVFAESNNTLTQPGMLAQIMMYKSLPRGPERRFSLLIREETRWPMATLGIDAKTLQDIAAHPEFVAAIIGISEE
jgi:hypothetical protein